MIVDLFGQPSPVGARMPDWWNGDAEFSGVEQAGQVPVYRFRLSRWWGGGKGTCAWLMLNPSTAGAEVGDPTVSRCIHFSWAWGFQRLEVVNLAPFRSPDPEGLRRWFALYEGDGMPLLELEAVERNLAACRSLSRSAERLVVAYGDKGQGMVPGPLFRATVEAFAGTWRGRARELHCLGLTAGGAPKHPMARGKSRVPDHQAAQVYAPAGWVWSDEER